MITIGREGRGGFNLIGAVIRREEKLMEVEEKIAYEITRVCALCFESIKTENHYGCKPLIREVCRHAH